MTLDQERYLNEVQQTYRHAKHIGVQFLKKEGYYLQQAKAFISMQGKTPNNKKVYDPLSDLQQQIEAKIAEAKPQEKETTVTQPAQEIAESTTNQEEYIAELQAQLQQVEQDYAGAVSYIADLQDRLHTSENRVQSLQQLVNQQQHGDAIQQAIDGITGQMALQLLLKHGINPSLLEQYELLESIQDGTFALAMPSMPTLYGIRITVENPSDVAQAFRNAVSALKDEIAMLEILDDEIEDEEEPAATPTPVPPSKPTPPKKPKK